MTSFHLFMTRPSIAWRDFSDGNDGNEWPTFQIVYLLLRFACGTPQASCGCLTVSCCDDATIQSTYCDTLLINCGTPEPCPPLNGDYAIEAIVTSGVSAVWKGAVGSNCQYLIRESTVIRGTLAMAPQCLERLELVPFTV